LRGPGRLVHATSKIVTSQTALARFALEERIARLRQIHEAKRILAGTVIGDVREPALPAS